MLSSLHLLVVFVFMFVWTGPLKRLFWSFNLLKREGLSVPFEPWWLITSGRGKECRMTSGLIHCSWHYGLFRTRGGVAFSIVVILLCVFTSSSKLCVCVCVCVGVRARACVKKTKQWRQESGQIPNQQAKHAIVWPLPQLKEETTGSHESQMKATLKFCVHGALPRDKDITWK